MKNVLLSVFVAFAAFSNAQKYVHQVLIVNEGYYDYENSKIVEPVTIGSYDPSTRTYEVVNTLSGMRFASDAIIADEAYFVAADQKIMKFDLNTHQLLAETTFSGVRNLAYVNGKIVASRGEYLTTYDSYLHVFNASDLSLISAIDNVSGPKWATQNLLVVGDCVYVAVNNGYDWGNEKGIIGRLDMNSLSYGNEVDLGPNGKNPDNMVLLDGSLYTVNNKDWSGASISKISLDGTINNTVSIATASTGCGTSAIRDNHIVYQISQETVLNEFEVTLMNNIGPIVGFDQNYYELAQNPVDGMFYASTTDYFSSGKINIYDGNNLVYNFNVGVSPGTIVFDIRTLLNLKEVDENELSIFPNPVNEEFQIRVNKVALVRISDLAGKTCLTTSVQPGSQGINLESFPQGSYTCTISFEDGSQSIRKITKY
jgi:hypothetical protein